MVLMMKVDLVRWFILGLDRNTKTIVGRGLEIIFAFIALSNNKENFIEYNAIVVLSSLSQTTPSLEPLASIPIAGCNIIQQKE